MSNILKQSKKSNIIGIHKNISSCTIHHNSLKPSILENSDKKVICSCISCLDPLCIKFYPEELKLSDERLNEFPADGNDLVCPVDAIYWEQNSIIPSIDIERCINCGICANRCIIGAIYSNGENAVIHFSENSVIHKPITEDVVSEHKNQILVLSKCIHTGQYLLPNDRNINMLYNKISSLKTDTQFPNLIVRNLFILLGNQCIIRRRGDIYFRIDAVLSDKKLVGIAEVEFKDSLESPRAILDDIAVLSSRYNIEKNHIMPFIISLEFPNLRTEYWRVIKDINDVLKLKIHSLSLGALCILLWHFNKVSIGNLDFYSDIETPSIRKSIEDILHIGSLSQIKDVAILEAIK